MTTKKIVLHHVLTLVLVLFNVTSMTIPLITSGSTFSRHTQESIPKPLVVNKAQISTPINIDRNTQLQAQASSGDGSRGTPYIIEDYSISNLGAGENGVTIQNTNKYFILRNITVENCSKGFVFINVTFGCIIDSSATHNRGYGFSLTTVSKYNILTSNTAINNWSAGFYLSNAYFNTFTRNSATHNRGDGFSLYSTSQNNTFNRNNATYNHGNGFDLYVYPQNNTFNRNSATHNHGNGFQLTGSKYNILTSNTAINNSLAGFYLSNMIGFSTGNILENNIGQNNQKCDYHTDSSSNNNILRANTFYTFCTPSTTTVPVKLLGVICAISLLIILRRKKH